MSWSSPSGIRILTGISSGEIPDSELQELCEYADRELFHEISIQVENEDLGPDFDGDWIDGSNKTFRTKNSPIADSNFDGQVSPDEVKVYLWSDPEDPDSRVQVEVSSVDPALGRVTLSSAPSTDTKRITADYYFYPNPLDFELVKKASNFLASFLAIRKKYGRLPVSVTIGRGLRVDTQGAGDEFYREYLKLLNLIKSRKFKKGEGEKKFDEGST